MKKNVCVITGGGSGMGLAAAKCMPKDKIIVVTGRTLSKLEKAVEELETLGYEAYAKTCDTSDRESVRELAAFADTPVYLSGDGYDMTKKALSVPSLADTPEELIYQSGYAVAMCALTAYQAGVRTTDAELAPTYLRLPQAERERLEKLNNDNT